MASRKQSLSISLDPDQAAWLDQQDESNSKIVRDALEEFRERESA